MHSIQGIRVYCSLGFVFAEEGDEGNFGTISSISYCLDEIEIN